MVSPSVNGAIWQSNLNSKEKLGTLRFDYNPCMAHATAAHGWSMSDRNSITGHLAIVLIS